MAKPHTQEEITWAKEKIRNLSKISEKTIRESNISSEYYKKFNRELESTGMVIWLKRIANPEYNDVNKNCQKVRRGGKSSHKVFEKSNYLVYVAGNIAGFETEKEVKDFLIQSQILSGIRLFELKPIKVKYDVEI